MDSKENTRRAEFLCVTETDRAWFPIALCDMAAGRTFRLFEADGTPVVDEQGRTEWIAAEDGFIDESGIYAVKIKAPEEQTHADT